MSRGGATRHRPHDTGETVTIDAAGLTDVGRERSANQDQFLIASMRKCAHVTASSMDCVEPDEEVFSDHRGHVLVVADGMGGHAGGDKASALAVHGAMRYVVNTMPWFFRLGEEESEGLERELVRSAERANEEVVDAARSNPRLEGMGTTLTMAYVFWPRLYVVHIGDSRAYVRRGGGLHRITTDHTVARRLVEEGVLKESEESDSPYSHVLWNAIGGDGSEIEPFVHRTSLRRGDTVLLCSDGLTGSLDDDHVSSILGDGPDSETACRRLVEEANAAGGHDNITAVVARFPAA